MFNITFCDVSYINLDNQPLYNYFSKTNLVILAKTQIRVICTNTCKKNKNNLDNYHLNNSYGALPNMNYSI